jgi:hypothetical protein
MIHEFALSYDTETISTQIPQGNESAEILLVEYNASARYGKYSIRNNEWYAQYFHPALPADAVSWKVTRVRFRAKQAGIADGEVKVQIRMAYGGWLAERHGAGRNDPPRVGFADGVYLQYEMTYTQVAGLSPQKGLCLVLKWVSGTVRL